MELQQKSEIVIGSLVLSLIVIFLSMTSMAIARAETTSDFTSDVQRGLQATGQGILISSIKKQDYQTSWDEFGTNALVDGASTPAEIQKDLTDDIVNSLQTELTYNQKDEQYLRLRHSSPEEVMALEGDGSGDLLPENYIEPNPSFEANPNVNPSALDMPASVVDTSGTLPASDVGLTPYTELIFPDNLVPPEGGWNPSELRVFETILNTDVPILDAPPSAPPDAETPPPADAPTN